MQTIEMNRLQDVLGIDAAQDDALSVAISGIIDEIDSAVARIVETETMAEHDRDLLCRATESISSIAEESGSKIAVCVAGSFRNFVSKCGVDLDQGRVEAIETYIAAFRYISNFGISSPLSPLGMQILEAIEFVTRPYSYH